MVPAHRRAGDLYGPHDLAARPGARHGQALGGRGVAEQFHRRDRDDEPGAVPRAGRGRLPVRRQADERLALRDNLHYNHVLHEHVVIVSVETGPVPPVNPSDQVVVDDLEYTDDVFYLTIQ